MNIRRAVLPASPEGDATPSSNLALLPLLSLSVVALILLYFVVRFVKRGLHFPNLGWLRGKGKGAKGRLGLSGVELLPTSFKSVPASTPSPFSAAFNLEGNAGKNGNLTLLSRSSSLDALPQLSTSSPPQLTSRKHSDWRAPFSLPAFLKTNNKPPHRRSRSLSTSHHTTSLSVPTSAPPTPSPKTLLIDISASGSSPMSASSDLGTHKLHSVSPPLIPGLPIPITSPAKMGSISHNSTQVWAFDVEDESHDIADSRVTGPLLAAFKRSQSEVHAKPPADPMPLIEYDRPSSPPPPTPPLVPKRLGTANSFATLVDSLTLQTFISDRRAASSSSLPLTPSFPPGIELVPIKPTAVQSTTNLLDFSNDDVEAGHENQVTLSTVATESTQRATFVPLITVDDDTAPTHDTHMETAIDIADSVSDPFDDSHAITLPIEAWNSGPVSPLIEEPHIPPEELAPPIQTSEPAPARPSPAPPSPFLLPYQVEPVEVAKPLPAEPEPTSSWQRNGSWSPPSIPDSHLAPEWPPVTDAILAKPEEGDDLMSFDHEEPVSVDEQAGQDRSGPVVELGIDVNKEMDPADTWFIEEPTAVWDASWTGENVKEGVLLEMGQEKGMEDDEVDVPRGEHINVLDELLAGPSEPIKIHIFEDIAEESVSEQPHSEHSEASTPATSSNDNHDLHEIIMPHSNVPTPMIHAATPLPSTPATPNTPLPELPSPVLVVSSPFMEEHPDPDIMPLPDFSSLSVVPMSISPVPIKPQPPSIHQAQTPTPPASPPPSFNVSARPSWSSRAIDAPALGLPAATIIPPVPEVRASEEAKPILEVENKKDDADRVIAVGGLPKEDIVVERVIEPAADEFPQELQEESTLIKPQLGLSTSIPGSFPASPSKVPAALPVDAVPPSPTAPTKAPQARAAIPASNRIRTPRSVIDIALAMQLRPGLGAGADPAWMVRFLMAVFGWFAILVNGDL